jgi:two-component system, NtrC family, sensor kinase
MLYLAILQGPDKGRTFELPDTEPQMLGRSSESLPLTDNTVSRRHAELTPDNGVWYLRDLSSQNGSYVNGVRVPSGQRQELKAGDQVRVGMTLFSFGRIEPRQLERVRVLRPDQVETNIERSLASNEDSVILALDADHRGGGGPGGTAAGLTTGLAAMGANSSQQGVSASALSSLRAMYRLTTVLSAVGDREALLTAVMDLLFAELRPERGCILLSEPAISAERGGEPVKLGDLETAAVRVVKAGRMFVPGPHDEPISVSRTILQHTLSRSEGVLASNAMSDERFRKGDSVQRLSIRSALCAPVRAGDRTIGAIYVDSSVSANTFNPDQLSFISAIGLQTGLALSHLSLLSQRLQTERLATMGQTVASLSHSIKNILQGLRGGADVVEMGLKKDDLKVARGGWPILKRNLDRIIGLTMNMLAYSRPRPPEMELAKMGALLEDCAGLLAEQCRLRGVALIVDADADMPPVAIDAGQIHQALMNLMANAVEAVEPRTGVVTVRASFAPETPASTSRVATEPAINKVTNRGTVIIEVIDNGPGVPAEIERRIFEPFFTTKGARGTGLGLAVTRRIVQQHGGTIDLRTSAGKGTTFIVRIPFDPEAQIDPSATAAGRSIGAHYRVDEP